ncbi:MAG: RNA polymerase sigma factor [Bacteroidales bacterium]
MNPDPRGGRGFKTTRWSVVVAAGGQGGPVAEEALAQLCHAYWYPLYAYVRRSGCDANDASDLTQEFFVQIIEKHYLRQADAQRGRFRSFLLASLKHFLANERRRANAKKRGGGRPALPLEVETAEGRYERELPANDTPERLFERRWALTLLDRTLGALREEHRANERLELFERLEPLLTDGKAEDSYKDIGKALGMSEGAVKVAAHRLRRRFGDLLRREIAQTVETDHEVDEEIRYLFSVLAS